MKEDASPVGENILREPRTGDMLIGGISAFNSAFTQNNSSRIGSIGKWMRERAEHIGFMFPDVPEEANLQALGYTDIHIIRRKIRKGFGKLMKKGEEVLKELDQDPKEGMLTWEKFLENPEYIKAHNALQNLYRENEEFQKDVREAALEVLRAKSQSPHFQNEHVDFEQAPELSKDFLLSELAFIVNAANILGKSRTAYVYHRETPVLRALLEGKYEGFTPPGNTGYIVTEQDSGA